MNRGFAGFSRGREHLAVVSRAVVTVVRGQSWPMQGRAMGNRIEKSKSIDTTSNRNQIEINQIEIEIESKSGRAQMGPGRMGRAQMGPGPNGPGPNGPGPRAFVSNRNRIEIPAFGIESKESNRNQPCHGSLLSLKNRLLNEPRVIEIRISGISRNIDILLQKLSP